MPDVIYIVLCNGFCFVAPCTLDGEIAGNFSGFGIPATEGINASHIVPLVIGGYRVALAIFGIHRVILVVLISSAICRQCLGVIACRHVAAPLVSDMPLVYLEDLFLPDTCDIHVCGSHNTVVRVGPCA